PLLWPAQEQSAWNPGGALALSWDYCICSDFILFTCVKTTKIYCRPICPSAHARRENVFFVASAAAAERLGFRPCLRCRPEAAPGRPAWRGTASTSSRRRRLFGGVFLDRPSGA